MALAFDNNHIIDSMSVCICDFDSDSFVYFYSFLYLLPTLMASVSLFPLFICQLTNSFPLKVFILMWN